MRGVRRGGLRNPPRDLRSSSAAPLVNFDRSDKPGAGGRLTSDGLAAVLRALSRRAGLARPARPHGLRHQGFSRALDLTNGNIRLVQRFARHADPRTTQRYDDNREDLAGVVTRLLGTDVEGAGLFWITAIVRNKKGCES